MQQWLRDRGQTVPDAKSTRMHDEDERHGARHAHARHADRRGDGRARQGARAGVRSAVPRRHDQAPPGRDRHGGRALQGVRRRRRTTTIYKFASDVYADQIDRDRTHEADARERRRIPDETSLSVTGGDGCVVASRAVGRRRRMRRSDDAPRRRRPRRRASPRGRRHRDAAALPTAPPPRRGTPAAGAATPPLPVRRGGRGRGRRRCLHRRRP